MAAPLQIVLEALNDKLADGSRLGLVSNYTEWGSILSAMRSVIVNLIQRTEENGNKFKRARAKMI